MAWDTKIAFIGSCLHIWKTNQSPESTSLPACSECASVRQHKLDTDVCAGDVCSFVSVHLCSQGTSHQSYEKEKQREKEIREAGRGQWESVISVACIRTPLRSWERQGVQMNSFNIPVLRKQSNSCFPLMASGYDWCRHRPLESTMPTSCPFYPKACDPLRPWGQWTSSTSGKGLCMLEEQRLANALFSLFISWWG